MVKVNEKLLAKVGAEAALKEQPAADEFAVQRNTHVYDIPKLWIDLVKSEYKQAYAAQGRPLSMSAWIRETMLMRLQADGHLPK